MIPINVQRKNEKIILENNIQELNDKKDKGELTFAEKIELKQMKRKYYNKFSKVE